MKSLEETAARAEEAGLALGHVMHWLTKDEPALGAMALTMALVDYCFRNKDPDATFALVVEQMRNLFESYDRTRAPSFRGEAVRK